MTVKSKLSRPASSLQGLIKDRDGLGFFPALYTKLLSQLAGPYVSVPQELRTLCGVIAKLENTRFTLNRLTVII